jgi:outer membrane biogenesis lipoprotein LolB
MVVAWLSAMRNHMIFSASLAMVLAGCPMQTPTQTRNTTPTRDVDQEAQRITEEMDRSQDRASFERLVERREARALEREAAEQRTSP